MDFARKQLEKYGWTDGKGLGKNENGISEAIKPKLKRSVAGIGHDPAADFTEHWWSQLYDKAANNVEVKEKNGKTKKIKTKDDKFKITNSTYHLTKSDSKSGDKEEYSEFFVKTILLTNGGSQERVRESESEEENGNEKKDVLKMTDEELFAACEGRTAHKGARHGLKATGKLARIERQEKELLALPKYTGYSHSTKLKIVQRQENCSDVDSEVLEQSTLNSANDCKIKKKKKKRKRCLNDDNVKEKSGNSIECMSEERDIEIVESNELPAEQMVKVKTKKKKFRHEEDFMETKVLGPFDNNDKAVQKIKKCKKKKKELDES